MSSTRIETLLQGTRPAHGNPYGCWDRLVSIRLREQAALTLGVCTVRPKWAGIRVSVCVANQVSGIFRIITVTGKDSRAPNTLKNGPKPYIIAEIVRSNENGPIPDYEAA